MSLASSSVLLNVVAIAAAGRRNAVLLLWVVGSVSLSLSRSEYSKQQTVVAVIENCNCIYNSTAALAPRFVYATYVVSFVVSFVVVPVVVYDAFGI